MSFYQRCSAPFLRFALVLSLFLFVGGCAYKTEIRQGNQRLQEHLDSLSVGMTQDEVVDLLGSPQTLRLFREDSWIYSYQIRESGFLDDPQLISVELLFDDNNTLSEIRRLRDDFSDDE